MVRALVLGSAAVVVGLLACGSTPAPPPKESPSIYECPTTGERTCKATSDCGATGAHCSGGRCWANHAGCPCTEADDCGTTAHCTSGTCYLNSAGSPCRETKECGARAHCTAGNCYANESGMPCHEANDCGPASSCVGGTCN